MHARALRQKWLAFQALEGQRLSKHVDRPRPIAHIGLMLTAGLLALVCSLNDSVATPHLQTIAQALFCALAAGLYAVSMGVWILMRWVMACVGEHELGTSLSSSSSDESEADEKTDDEEAQEEEPPPVFDRRDALPRETIVSSMYFGGLGMFLALGPLCMWNGHATLAFLSTLLLMSVSLEPITRQTTHALLLLAVLLTLMCAFAVQFAEPHLPPGAHAFEDNARITAQLAQLPRWPEWPFAFMAAASPCLLYLGSGVGLHAFLRMPPSKTLETGLPICLLMACIVLSWFNPLEALVLQELFQMRPWLLMSLLAPVLLIALLALLMQMLRSQSILTGLAALTVIFIVRQQSLRVGPVRALDAASIVCAALAVVLAGARLVHFAKL